MEMLKQLFRCTLVQISPRFEGKLWRNYSAKLRRPMQPTRVLNGLARFNNGSSLALNRSSTLPPTSDAMENARSCDATKPASYGYEKLKQLGWLIGSWVDRDDSIAIVTKL